MWRGCLVAAAMLLAVAAPSKQVSGASQFALWQRYGRGASALFPPRADRFYMTSRYGKRAESVQNGGLPPPLPDTMPDGPTYNPDSRSPDGDGPRPKSDDLRCWYIGIGDLYQCRAANEKSQSDNKVLEEAASHTYNT